MNEAIKEELSARQAKMTAVVRTSDTRLALAEQSLLELRRTDVHEQSEQDEEDVETASLAIETEIETLQSAQEAMRELISIMQAEKVEQALARSQSGCVNVSFGDDNRGFQVGSNTGHISGVSWR